MNAVDCVPLVEVTRGKIVESVHVGAYVLMNPHGQVVSFAGNPALMTYPRSSMKPFQVLPFIERGGVEAFGFSKKEVAIMCASHSGTDEHRDVLISMQKKIGISEADLSCGVHWPVDKDTREAMRLRGEEPTQNRHNCSGKHTGMLAHACMRDFPKEDYLNPDHPVQVSIRETLAEMVGMAPEAMPLGVDGCSAPVYGIPLENMAQGVAQMANPVELRSGRAAACRAITGAMMSHPTMVAGPDRFDTDLMKAARGKVFAKGGAEGYQIIGILPDVLEDHPAGLGFALKISDGDSRGRARASVSMTILRALGVLNAEELDALAEYGNVPVKNWRKLVVGEIHPAFSPEL